MIYIFVISPLNGTPLTVKVIFSPVFTVHNIDALKQVIRIVAVTSSQIGSKSSTAGDVSKQEQVIKDITEATKDIDGAQSEAAPAPASTDNYDDWD